jgi:hypothetical protein
MPSHHTVCRLPLPLLLLAFGLGGLGCSREDPAAAGAHPPAEHTHAAKHGGVAVELGEEEFHVEFTYGDTPGALLAYFMDAEMEDYVRITPASFAAVARVAGRDLPLVFQATASSATGETVGDTALFTATAGWLAERPAVKLTVPAITIKGRTYTAVRAGLPAGKHP